MTTAKRQKPTATGHQAPTTPVTSAVASDSAPQRRGRVEVSAHAIASIAAQAACECYGVTGMAARGPHLGSVQRLAPEDYARGVAVRFVNDHVVIDLWVILEHSLRVVEVAHNVMALVKYAVEQALGLHVVEVNVNVQALNVR